MIDEQRIGHAIVDLLLQFPRVVGILTAPNVEYEPPGFFRNARRGLFVIKRSIANRTLQGVLIARQQRHRRCIAHAQCVGFVVRVDDKTIRREGRRHEQRKAVVEVEADMTGRKHVPAVDDFEAFRLGDAIAVPEINAMGVNVIDDRTELHFRYG